MKLRQLTTGFILAALYPLPTYAANCEYLIKSEWSNGFTASIKITNNTTTAINGWSVQWAYPDGSRRTGGWNATVTGNNPYVARDEGWNNKIHPGRSIEFGIQGTKGVANVPAIKGLVSGDICQTASSRSSYLSNSSQHTSSHRSPSSQSKSSQSSRWISSLGSRTSSQLSSLSSQPYSSSSSHSANGNHAPVADLAITTTGLTVYADARASYDPDNDPVTRSFISFSDGGFVDYPYAWHTFSSAGTYEISLTVYDNKGGSHSVKKSVQLTPATGNRAPINMLTATRSGYWVNAFATASFDEDGDPLQYIWNTGNGEFVGENSYRLNECIGGSSASSGTSSSVSSWSRVTLTVTDGVLADTKQVTTSANCNFFIDKSAQPVIDYRIEGATIFVDARRSVDITNVTWHFGDGATSNDLVTSHTYAEARAYELRLYTDGNPLGNANTIPINITAAASSSPSSTPVAQ